MKITIKKREILSVWRIIRYFVQTILIEIYKVSRHRLIKNLLYLYFILLDDKINNIETWSCAINLWRSDHTVDKICHPEKVPTLYMYCRITCWNIWTKINMTNITPSRSEYFIGATLISEGYPNLKVLVALGDGKKRQNTSTTYSSYKTIQVKRDYLRAYQTFDALIGHNSKTTWMLNQSYQIGTSGHL